MLCQTVLDAVGRTPLVRLNRIARGLKPLLAAKLEFVNPGGSVKDRIALAMIEDAERRGLLKPGGTIIEGTSGNTGMGLAMVAAVKGYQAIFTMPDKMSQEKMNALRALGAEVVVTPTAVAHDDPRSYHSVALRLNREIPNSYFPNQYENPYNVQAHYETTGPELWEQTEGRLTHIVIGVGTGGTITGVGRYLKERNPAIRVIGVDPVGSIFHDLFKTGKQGPSHPYKVEGVGQDELPKNVDFAVIDDILSIGDKESFLTARALARQEGILGGGSSGMALAAALKLARGAGERDYIVVLLPDSGSRYLTKIYNDAWMQDNQFLDAPIGFSLGTVLAGKERTHAGLIAVESDATIGQAIERMRGHGISQMPVLAKAPAGATPQVLGALHETHLLNLLLTHSEAWHHNVLEFMDPPLPQVGEDTPAAEMLKLLERDPAVLVQRLDGTLNIITKSDLLFTLLKSERDRGPA